MNEHVLIYKPLYPYGFDLKEKAIEATLELGWTEIEPPQPNWQPSFDWQSNQWLELLPEEEQVEPNEEEGLSDIEQLGVRQELLEDAVLELSDLLMEFQNFTGVEGRDNVKKP